MSIDMCFLLQSPNVHGLQPVRAESSYAVAPTSQTMHVERNSSKCVSHTTPILVGLA